MDGLPLLTVIRPFKVCTYIIVVQRNRCLFNASVKKVVLTLALESLVITLKVSLDLDYFYPRMPNSLFILPAESIGSKAVLQ